jgi:hypothetical protein
VESTTTQLSAIERARQALDVAETAWRPATKKDHPQVVAGDVVAIEMRGVNTAQGYQQCPVVVLDAGEVVWAVWAWHSVLRSALARANVQPGDTIAIRYNGLQEPAGGAAYHSYTVRRADSTDGKPFDWGQVATEPEPVAAVVANAPALAPQAPAAQPAATQPATAPPAAPPAATPQPQPAQPPAAPAGVEPDDDGIPF